MRLGTAIEHLVDNYKYASDKEWIQNKVAWALYYTWKEADDRKTENSSEIPNNCEPQKWTKENCKGCKWWSDLYQRCCRTHIGNECHYEPKDETQTCEECEHWNDTEDGCADRHGCKDEPTGYNLQPIDKDINVRSKDEPQTDGILFKGNLKEGDYKLIKTSNGWVLEGDIAYYGEPQTERSE